MLKYKATIHIMPRPELLDPQGKATLLGLHNLGFEPIEQVRIGKQVELRLEAESQESASEYVNNACKKLLVNPIIEQYYFELQEIQ